jgi:predicted metalloendopeptidase
MKRRKILEILTHTPNTKDDAKKRNRTRQTYDGQDFSTDSDDYDLMSWSPLQEVIDALPTFNKTT